MANNRRYGTRIREVIAVALAAATIIPYIWVSLVINTGPWSDPFDGWVALVEPQGQAYGGQLELRTVVTQPDAGDGKPRVRYFAIACGPTPFEGLLLLGGDARLREPIETHFTAMPLGEYATISSLPPPTLRTINLVYSAREQKVDLGDVQVIDLRISPDSTCPATQPQDGLESGNANIVEGRMQGAIQYNISRMGMESNVTTMVWPLVGSIPRIDPRTLAEYHALEGLPGYWRVPPTTQEDVTIGRLPVNSVLDTSLPPVSNAGELAWHSEEPIQPIARLNSVGQLTTLQQYLTWASIALGVGGSILASALFEWIRGRERDDTCVATPDAPDDSRSRPRPLSIAIVAIIAYLVGRSRP